MHFMPEKAIYLLAGNFLLSTTPPPPPPLSLDGVGIFILSTTPSPSLSLDGVGIFVLSTPPSLSLGGVGKEKTFTDLRKHVFDNMSSYLARKEERIREQEERKTTRLDPVKERQTDKDVYKPSLGEVNKTNSSTRTSAEGQRSLERRVMDNSSTNVDDKLPVSVEQSAVSDTGVPECSLIRNNHDTSKSVASAQPPEKKLKRDYI